MKCYTHLVLVAILLLMRKYFTLVMRSGTVALELTQIGVNPFFATEEYQIQKDTSIFADLGNLLLVE